MRADDDIENVNTLNRDAAENPRANGAGDERARKVGDHLSIGGHVLVEMRNHVVVANSSPF